MLVTDHETFSVPRSVSACKIVFFSDVHLGKLAVPGLLARAVKRINAQKPDLVIFGGDLIDNYARDKSLLDLEEIARELSSINAKYGKYAVYGNHDYGGGAVRIYEDLMVQGGFTVLRGESVVVPELGVRVVGYDDLQMGYTAPALYNLTSEQYKIIVSHAPDVADSVASETPALMLGGHSHGGQILLPFLTKAVLPEGGQVYWKDTYHRVGVKGNLSVFVSTGLGMTTMPYRFLTPPEIAVLTLEPEA